jgi:hypothetical protein
VIVVALFISWYRNKNVKIPDQAGDDEEGQA